MTSQSLFNDQPSTVDGFGLLGTVFLILTLATSSIVIMTLINPAILTRQGRETVDKAKILRASIQSYQFSHGGAAGAYPPSLDALVTPEAAPCLINNDPTQLTYLFLQGWCGPYVDQSVTQDLADYKTDGWGTVFSYDSATGILTSCGTDQVCGGADDVVFNP